MPHTSSPPPSARLSGVIHEDGCNHFDPFCANEAICANEPNRKNPMKTVLQDERESRHNQRAQIRAPSRDVRGGGLSARFDLYIKDVPANPASALVSLVTYRRRDAVTQRGFACANGQAPLIGASICCR